MRTLASIPAIVLSLVFLAPGLSQIVDPGGWAIRLIQEHVPPALGLTTALTLGILETCCGALIAIPRFRRWGSILAGSLVAMVGVHFVHGYGRFRGHDCDCFPGIEWTVGPGFLLGLAALLLVAIFVGVIARPPRSSVLASLLVAGVAFCAVGGQTLSSSATAPKIPRTIRLDGKDFSLARGKALLFFFDPGCGTCASVARRMSRYDWKNTQVIAIPVRQPQFARQFLNETGLHASVSADLEPFKDIFGPHVPSCVAVEDGKPRAILNPGLFSEEPKTTLRSLSFVN